LGEEFSRCGVEIVFLKSPAGSSPEDQLVVQFQGMIAEYERAQIAERSRRGKLYKAKQGVVNALSAAPYGYKYIRKTDTSIAYYEVIESEAGVVRMVFKMYTQQNLPQHQSYCALFEPARDFHKNGEHAMGPLGGMGHAA
jgi:site-specific DNA recombinase